MKRIRKMFRLIFGIAVLTVFPAACFAQEQEPAANPFGPSDAVDADSQRTALHPDGDTPAERMLSLAHTEALPRFDRLELYAVSMPKPFSDEKPKREPSDKTFPVRPYGVHADILAHKSVTGDACVQLYKTWRSLSFDRLGGAMCHYPAYGLRMYRGDMLLFETTVCWECQNFYIPRYNPDKKRYTHGWYGFADDDHAKSLLKQIRSLVPHPKL